MRKENLQLFGKNEIEKVEEKARQESMLQ